MPYLFVVVCMYLPRKVYLPTQTSFGLLTMQIMALLPNNNFVDCYVSRIRFGDVTIVVFLAPRGDGSTLPTLY